MGNSSLGKESDQQCVDMGNTILFAFNFSVDLLLLNHVFSLIPDLGDLIKGEDRIDPCGDSSDNCYVAMKNHMDIANRRYPESSRKRYCSCTILLNTTTKITFYDAGVSGSGDTTYPLSFNIGPSIFRVDVNRNHFEQVEHTVEVDENASRTITIEIQPDEADHAVEKMWFWIHLEGIL